MYLLIRPNALTSTHNTATNALSHTHPLTHPRLSPLPPPPLTRSQDCTTCTLGSYSSTICGSSPDPYGVSIQDTHCSACSQCDNLHYEAYQCTVVSDTICNSCMQCIFKSQVVRDICQTSPAYKSWARSHCCVDKFGSVVPCAEIDRQVPFIIYAFIRCPFITYSFNTPFNIHRQHTLPLPPPTIHFRNLTTSNASPLTPLYFHPPTPPSLSPPLPFTFEIYHYHHYHHL